MAKRSQKRLSRKEREQAGCMWGLISMFDFRHGSRPTKRLLLDKRRTSKQAIGAAHLSNQTIPPDPTETFENIADCEESDTAKTSVKELMEEEMFNEQGPTNKSNNSEIDSDQIEQNLERNSNDKSRDLDASEFSEQKPSDILDLQTIIQELANIYHDDNPDHKLVVEEKLVAAIKLFIEERMSDSKHFEEEGKSKEFTDALRTLTTNKSLFLKLLQDPNSLLVQQIHSLDDACLKKRLSRGSSSSEDKSVNKHRNFFRRRSKSMEINPVGMQKDSQQFSSKIIILKPGPAVAEKSPETDIARNASSQFSFTEIKRKLRHAMGKERPGISSKPQNGENLGWSSPNRNHFYTERFTTLKKSEEVGGKSKDKSSRVANENTQCMRPGVSDIYMEAKRQISEILNSGENAESMTGGNKSLGRILSFSDYNSSPCCSSPRTHGNEIFVTAQMRLSPRGILQENNLSPRKNLESNFSDTNEQECSSADSAIRKDESSSSKVVEIDETAESKPWGEEKIINSITADVQNGDIREVVNEETTESETQEQEKMTNFSSESDNSSIAGDIQNGDIGEVDEEEAAGEEFIRLDLFGEDQILSPRTMSPSCSSGSKEVEDSESGIDKMERPSPISVLEPLFTDDDISPARTISQPVEKDIRPRHIHFEKQSDEETCIRISNEDEESAFEYVEAVLLGSGLNWDEFLLRWLSLYEILDSSLFDEVELFSSRSHHDQKLLFDCANDALKDVCESYFGGFTGISKKNMKMVPKGMDLINEIWDRVEGHMSQNPQPLSLDQLVKRDMPKTGKWMNLQPDIEVIGFEIGEEISDELIEDILSFLDDISIYEIEAELNAV